MIKLKQEDPRYKLDLSKKVFVYKNLHKDCWSIKQDGLVKAHSDKDPISLYETSLVVILQRCNHMLKKFFPAKSKVTWRRPISRISLSRRDAPI